MTPHSQPPKLFPRGPPLLRPQLLGAEGTRWVRNGDLVPQLPPCWGPGLRHCTHPVSPAPGSIWDPVCQAPSVQASQCGGRTRPLTHLSLDGAHSVLPGHPHTLATLVSPEGWLHGFPLPRGHLCSQALIPGDLPKPQKSNLLPSPPLYPSPALHQDSWALRPWSGILPLDDLSLIKWAAAAFRRPVWTPGQLLESLG